MSLDAGIECADHNGGMSDQLLEKPGYYEQISRSTTSAAGDLASFYSAESRVSVILINWSFYISIIISHQSRRIPQVVDLE